jgi:hypothetical protein
VVTTRRTLTAAALIGGVVVGRLVAGVWITAAVMAAVATVGLVAGLAVIDRAFDRRAPAARVVTGPRGPGRHVEFARTLAAVAAAYLAECEADEQRETGR